MDDKVITIKRMDGEDAYEVSNLISDMISSLTYYNEFARQSEIEKYRAFKLLEMIESDEDSVLIAKQKERVVGFCLTYYDDGLIWLSWIGVHKDSRRCGLAQMLLLEMEKTVRPRGAHKIWCDCRTDNEPSKALLTRLGYKQICNVNNHWYGQDFILWEKTIT